MYRIQNRDTTDGMWRTTFNGQPAVLYLSDKRLANLPMPEDKSKYNKDGKEWKCAVDNIEKLYDWFSKEDILELIKMNFFVMKFETDDYIDDGNQILFNCNSMKNVVEITINLYNIN